MKKQNNNELNELKIIWQKVNAEQTEYIPDDFRFVFSRKGWFVQNRLALDGIACIAVSLTVATTLVVNIHSFKDMPLSFIFGIIISVYVLVKGLLTVFFFNSKRKLDYSVNRFRLDQLKNKLFFIYERMLWLWFLSPALIVVLPLLLAEYKKMPGPTLLLYCVCSGILYLFALCLFSKPLVRKRRCLKAEIEEIKASIC